MIHHSFNNGLIVGRFEPLHIGHQHLINTALSNCDRVLIFITTNTKKDKNNPFSFSYRKYLINKVFKNEINAGRIVISNFINKVSFDHIYGKSLLKKAKEILNDDVNCIIYGSDKNIEKCFSKEDVKLISQIRMNRNIVNISSTKVRELLIKKDIENLKKMIDKMLYEDIDNMIKIVHEVK